MISATSIALPSAEKVNLALEQNNFCHSEVAVAPSAKIEGQSGLIAQGHLPPGTVVFVHHGKVSPIRTRTSIQAGTDIHVEADGFGVFTNHSCNPNAVVRSQRKGKEIVICLITIRAIALGEEICFDYATTETVLTPALQNKPCLCGSKNCRGVMTGYNQLSAIDKQKIQEIGLPDYISCQEMKQCV